MDRFVSIQPRQGNGYAARRHHHGKELSKPVAIDGQGILGRFYPPVGQGAHDFQRFRRSDVLQALRTTQSLNHPITNFPTLPEPQAGAFPWIDFPLPGQ